MYSRFEYHLRTSQYRLSGKGIGGGAGHSPHNGGIGHSFNQHKYISRRTSADRNDGIHHILGNNFAFAETVQQRANGFKLIFGYGFVAAYGSHTLAYHSGRIRHSAYGFYGFTEPLFKLF